MKMQQYKCAKYSKGQMKIQQMAFVLIAIMIFFGMVVVGYLTIKTNKLNEQAQVLKDEGAKELVRRIASLPEFSWSSCVGCIDMDKALIMKERKTYQGFWELDYLKIDQIYRDKKGECTRSSYPNCRELTLINSTGGFGIASSAFVSLCRKASEEGRIYDYCTLGRVYASGKGVGGK